MRGESSTKDAVGRCEVVLDVEVEIDSSVLVLMPKDHASIRGCSSRVAKGSAFLAESLSAVWASPLHTRCRTIHTTDAGHDIPRLVSDRDHNSRRRQAPGTMPLMAKARKGRPILIR